MDHGLNVFLGGDYHPRRQVLSLTHFTIWPVSEIFKMKRIIKEYRYQFIKFEDIETGKFRNLGALGLGCSASSMKIPITEEVAVVFDKKLGIIKHTKIKRLK